MAKATVATSKKNTKPASKKVEPKVASKKVKFVFKGESGKSVFVAGSFNNWSALNNQLKENGKTGVYSATVTLSKGRYEYKFVIDNTWCVDPECPEWVPNHHGSLNSVIAVE